jgi:uncharacterized protein YehS (DUF1456 family)
MTNNYILLSIRDSLALDNSKMSDIFAAADFEVSSEQINSWLTEEDNPEYKECSDTQLAIFLNGLINYKRGKKDGPQPEPEKILTNNVIFRKLKIALNLKADDVLDILELADVNLNKYELNAYFRKPNHKNYRHCRDKLLRNFLTGIKLKNNNQDNGENNE